MVKKDNSFDSYRSRVIELYTRVNHDEIQVFANTIKNVITDSGTIYILGNGGSASTASHFATDLINLSHRLDIGLRVFSLVDNSSIISAIANDISFDDIFLAQLQNVLRSNDLVFSISASGNSTNLIKAVTYSNKIGAITASLLGFEGGILKNISKISCHLPTNINEYGPVEDVHLSICHYLASSVKYNYEI